MSDRQQANAALAVLAKAGNAYALSQLWEMNQGFINTHLWKWYTTHRETCDAAAITYEDLQQEGFFAVQQAVVSYDPEKGAFTTYLDYHLQSIAGKAVVGSSGRYVECSDGVSRRVSANPINGAVALDEPLPGIDDTDVTRLDMLGDPTSQAPFEAIEDASAADELRRGVNAAVDRLDPRETEVIRGRYLLPEPLNQGTLGERLGVSRERVRQLEGKAFRKLCRDKDLQRLHNEIVSQHAYSGTGFTSWKNRGSAQERTIEHLERCGALWSAEEMERKTRLKDEKRAAELGITIEELYARRQYINQLLAQAEQNAPS
ncbi:MAG: sigma-70 family RNA polymerase sigma factor [Faecalibacterium sp.]|nr:sigma-70 family RNA polymerase sigma factor [Faecalibacterium sp.]